MVHAGKYDSMVEASEFDRVIQHRTDDQIGCVDEIVGVNTWIENATLGAAGQSMEKLTEFSERTAGPESPRDELDVVRQRPVSA